MRSGDRAVPTINPDRPTVEPFPAVLHIGVAREAVPAYVWDDRTGWYDDPDRDYVWDDVAVTEYDRFELWCRFHGLTITTGNPDAEGIFEAGHVEMTLDNRDGLLSQYDETGRLVDWLPGQPLDVWAFYGGHNYWLFSGVITVWRELADGTVEVEAFDAFSGLQQFIGTWTPGVVGDTVEARLNRICTRAGYTGPKRFATGTITCLTEADDITPLEAMQQTARSDSGVLYVDPDGTLVYDPRTWIAGRADQPAVPLLTDNVCDADAAVVWEPWQTTDDEPIVNTVTLANLDDVEVSAANKPSQLRHGIQTWPSSRTADLWATAAQGQDVADWIVSKRGDAYLRLEQAVLYLHDARQNLWPIGIDTRVGDLVDWLHQQATTTDPWLIELTLVVTTVIHDITPDTWVTTLGTTTAVDYRSFVRWDLTTFVWDEADPDNIYGR